MPKPTTEINLLLLQGIINQVENTWPDTLTAFYKEVADRYNKENVPTPINFGLVRLRHLDNKLNINSSHFMRRKEAISESEGEAPPNLCHESPQVNDLLKMIGEKTGDVYRAEMRQRDHETYGQLQLNGEPAGPCLHETNLVWYLKGFLHAKGVTM